MSVQDSNFDQLYHAALKELEANSIVGDPQIADLLAKRDLVLEDCKDDYLRRHKEAVDHFEECLRLRACMERSKNGVGGVLRYFEEDGNAIGQAMMEGVYLDLEETLARSVSEQPPEAKS